MTDHPRPAAGVFVSILLPTTERWRCAVWDRGFGLVVGQVELCGAPTSYEVDFDDGGTARLTPSQLRRVDADRAA